MSQKYPMVLRAGQGTDSAWRKSFREDAAWTRLYDQVENPAVAEAVVKALVEAPEAFPDCQALYLSALATIHRHQARQEQVQWLAGMLRMAIRLPGRAYRGILRLVPRKHEPAFSRIEVLNDDPATVSSVRSAFDKADSGQPADQARTEASAEAGLSATPSGNLTRKAA